MTKKSEKESTLYYFYSQGCGYCKKLDPIVEELNNNGHDILRLDLSDKDNAGLRREIENKYDLRCGTPFLVDGSSGNHICGFREKDIIEMWANGEEVPEPPKPTGPPPTPPQDFDNSEEVETWRKDYQEWYNDNQHLPNLPDWQEMLERLKMRKVQYENKVNNPPGPVGEKLVKMERGIQNRLKSLEAKMMIIEDKLDEIIGHE
tara:strand:- start:433 stop:1044 length:612 start_codon:yes stop_codon:yes gene_type:complete